MQSIRTCILVNFIKHNSIKNCDKVLNILKGSLTYFFAADKMAIYDAYLKKEFDVTIKEAFNIFSFIKEAPAAGIFDLLVNSNYFNSMPDEYAIEALETYSKFASSVKNELFYNKSFADFLLSKIPDTEENRHYICNHSIVMTFCSKDAVVNKLMSFKDIDLFNKGYAKISIDLSNYEEKFYENFSLGDLKKYCLSEEFTFQNVDFILSYFLNYPFKGIDTLLSLLGERIENELVDDVLIYHNFVMAVKESKFLKENHILYLESLISKTLNFDLIYEWLLNVNFNKEMFNVLFNNKRIYLISNLLLFSNKEVICQVLNQFKDTKDLNIILDFIISKLEMLKNVNEDITSIMYVVDTILSILFNNYPDLKIIDKNNCDRLLNLNTIHIIDILKQHVYPPEEKRKYYDIVQKRYQEICDEKYAEMFGTSLLF